jgi:hypothetical protein
MKKLWELVYICIFLWNALWLFIPTMKAEAVVSIYQIRTYAPSRVFNQKPYWLFVNICIKFFLLKIIHTYISGWPGSRWPGSAVEGLLLVSTGSTTCHYYRKETCPDQDFYFHVSHYKLKGDARLSLLGKVSLSIYQTCLLLPIEKTRTKRNAAVKCATARRQTCHRSPCHLKLLAAARSVPWAPAGPPWACAESPCGLENWDQN